MKIEYTYHTKTLKSHVLIQTGRTSVALCEADASYGVAYKLAQDFGLSVVHYTIYGNGRPEHEIHEVAAPVIL